MNIYRISQDGNTRYDTYDSAVVVAENEEDARSIHPDGGEFDPNEGWPTWCKQKEDVKVEYMGIADKSLKRGVILSSFNAG